MPSSRRRKRQTAANRRQIEKARRRLHKEGLEKENRGPLLQERRSSSSLEDQSVVTSGDEAAVVRGRLDGLYNWCYSSLTQSVDTVKDIVFPSRVLRRQLDDAEQRLRVMEEELNMIRNQEIRERKRRKKMRLSTGTMKCVEPPQSTIPAAPPLPPPPPPPPPPPSLVSQPRIITRSRVKQMVGQKQQVQPSITLDDIKSVKLRSTRESRGVKLHRSSSSSGFVVSLADLKSVNLRKTATTRRRSLHSSSSHHETLLSQDFTNIRSSLRRVRRSPTGTLQYPNNKLVADSGEGPTPMLTRALRRKFRVACPLSPISSVSPSPVVSPISQALPSPPPPSTQTTVPPSPPPNSTQTIATTSSDSILEIREI